MAGAQEIGHSGRVAVYEISDADLAVGSTLGGPKVTIILKASGAIEKVYSVDMGQTVFGTVLLRHYDTATGAYLEQSHPGTFIIHPEHQEHRGIRGEADEVPAPVRGENVRGTLQVQPDDVDAGAAAKREREKQETREREERRDGERRVPLLFKSREKGSHERDEPTDPEILEEQVDRVDENGHARQKRRGGGVARSSAGWAAGAGRAGPTEVSS